MADESAAFEQTGYLVTVLGATIAVRSPKEAGAALTSKKGELLERLVIAGQRGLLASDLPPDGKPPVPITNDRLRMAVARLRDHVPKGSLPTASQGRYRLRLAHSEVDLWHLRELAAGARLDGLTPFHLRHLLTSRASSTLGDSILDEEIATLQHSLLTRIWRERPEWIAPDLAARLTEHVERNPYDEELASIVAQCLVQAGRRREAINVISTTIAALSEIGVTASTDLQQLQIELLDALGPRGSSLVSSNDGHAGPLDTSLPAALGGLASIPLIGRVDLLDTAWERLVVGPRRLLLMLGAPGSGMTRLCVELARRAGAHEMCTLYGEGSTSGEAAYGPLMAAVPGVRRMLAAALDSTVDPYDRRGRAWMLLRDELDRLLGDSGVLIIDRAQLADRHTLDFLADAARDVSRKWRVVVAGSAASGDAHFASYVARMRELGILPTHVPEMTPDEFGMLVRAHLPSVDGRKALATAGQLYRLTQGRPGPALLLLQSAPESIDDPQFLRSSVLGRALDHVLKNLPKSVRLVGAAASIFDALVSVHDLVTIAGLSERTVLDALDQLALRGLVVERGDDGFSIESAEAGAALLRSVLRRDIAQLHQRAAGVPHLDPAVRARHFAAAGSAEHPIVAAAGLRACGHDLTSAGRYAEGAVALAEARHRSPGDESIDDLVALTRCLELSGEVERARELRAQSVEVLAVSGDHNGAFRVATSGMPEAEPLGGDRLLIAYLSRLDSEKLDSRFAVQRAQLVARQCILSGDIEAAEQALDDAAGRISNDSERFRNAVLRRWIGTHLEPAARLAITDGLTEVVLTNSETAEVQVLRAVDHYEAGDIEAARIALEELRQLGEALPSTRRWHLRMFDATLASDAGRLAEAAVLRTDARRIGVACGASEADIAHVGASFVLATVLGAPFDSAALPPGLPANLPPLVRAYQAINLDSRGSREDATEEAEALAQMVLRSPVSGGLPAVALVCGLLSRSDDRALKRGVDAILESRGASMLLVGAGSVSLGPVQRYRAELSVNRSERAALLRSAASVAERCQAALWMAVSWRDLIDAGLGRDQSRALRSLVEGTELAPFFARYR